MQQFPRYSAHNASTVLEPLCLAGCTSAGTSHLQGQAGPKDLRQLPAALGSDWRFGPKWRPLNCEEGDQRVLLGTLTWGHGLHVSGELAAHVVVVGADVVETPVRQLVRTVELGRHRLAGSAQAATVAVTAEASWDWLSALLLPPPLASVLC